VTAPGVSRRLLAAILAVLATCVLAGAVLAGAAAAPAPLPPLEATPDTPFDGALPATPGPGSIPPPTPGPQRPLAGRPERVALTGRIDRLLANILLVTDGRGRQVPILVTRATVLRHGGKRVTREALIDQFGSARGLVGQRVVVSGVRRPRGVEARILVILPSP
jgi:hypothetical protein